VNYTEFDANGRYIGTRAAAPTVAPTTADETAEV
jgi:hypothetical protein